MVEHDIKHTPRNIVEASQKEIKFIACRYKWLWSLVITQIISL